MKKEKRWKNISDKNGELKLPKISKNFLMKNSKSKQAFSLMELSIVILIIGVLIAGITQVSSFLGKVKLASARSVTQGSPANGVKDLALWLDATAEQGLSASLNDQDAVSQWKDTNPQQSSKSDATASGTQRPLYVTNGINGLPALKCDGVDDALSIASGTNYFPTTSPSITNNFTIFLVARATATHEIDTQANSGTSGITGQKYVLWPSTSATTGIAGSGISLGTNGVSVYEHGGGYLPAIAVYSGANNLSAPAVITVDYNNKTPTIFINGTSAQTGLTSTQDSIFPSRQFCSGAYGAFNGNIGEIIVFGKRVPTAKRQQIEKYLGKKWGIKIS